MNKKNIFIIAITFLTYSLFAKSTYASGLSVGLYPSINKIVADNNAHVVMPISLQNYDNDTVELEIKVRAFVPSNRFDGDISLVSESTKLSSNYETLRQRIKVFDEDQEINNITLSPLQRKNLTVQIEIPKDQPGGDYYYSVIAKSKPVHLDQTNLSSIAGGIASNLLITIGKVQNPTAVIQDFSTLIFSFKGPINLSLLVENTGPNSFSPKGSVVIKNIYGQVVGAIQTVPVNILSHSSRFIPSVNSGSKTQILWNEKNPLGFYTVELTLALSENGPLFQRKTYFFAAPLKTIAFSLIFLMIVIYVIKKTIFKIHKDKILN